MRVSGPWCSLSKIKALFLKSKKKNAYVIRQVLNYELVTFSGDRNSTCFNLNNCC